MSYRRLLCGLTAALMSTGVAQAREWVVSVGAKATSAPPYEGADHNVLRPTPTLSARPADRPYRFTPADGGTSFALISTDHFEFGPMARFQQARKNTGELRGLDKVKWAAEPGAFVDIWPATWLRLHVEGRRGVTGHRGWVGDAGVDLVYTSPKWDLSVGPRAGWGDRRYLSAYFGVTPAEAARSPLINAAYSTGAGRRYAGVNVSSAYHLTERWDIRSFVGYRRLAEKAGDSPIVAIAGSRNQYMGSVGVAYRFDIGL